MTGILFRYGGIMLFGFLVAWYVQSIRWDNDVSAIKIKQSNDLLVSWAAGEEKAKKAEDLKEAVQNEFNTFRKSESERNAAISSGVKRVHVRAACPSVQGVSTGASGTQSGSAELDPAYRQALSDLRSGAEEQLRLLNICRSELMAK